MEEVFFRLRDIFVLNITIIICIHYISYDTMNFYNTIKKSLNLVNTTITVATGGTIKKFTSGHILDDHPKNGR